MGSIAGARGCEWWFQRIGLESGKQLCGLHSEHFSWKSSCGRRRNIGR